MKIKLANRIDREGLELLDDHYEYGEDIENEDGLLVRSAKLHEYAFPQSLLAIARAGAGVNNIPLDKCSQQGIVVFNTPGANANAVTELTICCLLLASRKISEGIQFAKNIGEDEDFSKTVEKEKGRFVGPEIINKKLGVIGLGAIGVGVANDAVALGMQVYGYDPYISVNAAWSLSKWVKHVTDINEIFRQCDYITVHVPLNNETRDLINAETLKIMKKGIRIINLARGELVNEDAVIQGLNEGIIERYVTDFGSYRLANTEKVVCLPHLGASTFEAEKNCAIMAVRELVDYLENGNIVNSVNLPSIVEPRSTAHRICIIHRNLANMLGQLTGVIGSCGINIENMVNKARGEMAYTVIDTNSEVDLKALENIDNVIRVRYIA